MAIIPSSISTSTDATSGEKKIHQLLSDLYGDSDDVFVWYEPPPFDTKGNRESSNKAHTDFILYSQTFGLLNLEVKDWKISNIRKIEPKTWEIITADGKVKVSESPFEQSRRCAYGIKNKLEKEYELLHTEGNHKGKIIFPFGYGVIFTNMSKADLLDMGGIGSVINLAQILCRDELSVDVSEKDQRLKFEKRLKQMFITAKFDFEPLSHRQIKILRKTIWPELVLTPIREEKKDTFDLKILDLEQENFAKTLGEGHYLIKGVAGSGKTLVLAYRARYLHLQHPNWKILFLCYNVSLRKYVEAMIKNIMPGRILSNINILHFHGLVKEMTAEKLQKSDDENSDQWDERIGLLLRNAVLTKNLKNSKYNAIMIDEAQDFSTEWLKGVVGLLDDTDSLTVALDPAQDVYGRKRIWKDSGIEVLGRRSRKLKQSYRNTNEILKLAIEFQGQTEYLEDDNPDSPLKPQEIERHGSKPVILGFNSYKDVFNKIENDIIQFKNEKNYNFNDISIISCSYKFNDVLRKEKIFTRIPVKICLETIDRHNLDVNDNTVKIITVESSKGLEWKVVFLVGIEHMPRTKRETKHEKNLVYIGITRAQELLNIYYIDDLTILLNGNSNFINQLKKINES